MSQVDQKKTYEIKKIGKHWLIGIPGKRFQRLPVLANAIEVVAEDNFLIVDDDNIYEIEESEHGKVTLVKLEDAFIDKQHPNTGKEFRNAELTDENICQQNEDMRSKPTEESVEPTEESVVPLIRSSDLQGNEAKHSFPITIIHEDKTADKMNQEISDFPADTKNSNIHTHTLYGQNAPVKPMQTVSLEIFSEGTIDDELGTRDELDIGNTEYDSLEAGNTEETSSIETILVKDMKETNKDLNTGATALKTEYTVPRNETLQDVEDLNLYVEMQNIPAGETTTSLKTKVFDLHLPIPTPELIFCEGSDTAIMICRSAEDAALLSCYKESQFIFRRLKKTCMGVTARLDARIWNIAKANNYVIEIKDKLKDIHVIVIDDKIPEVKANTLYQVKCARTVLAKYDLQGTSRTEIETKVKRNSFLMYESEEVLGNITEQVWCIVNVIQADDIKLLEDDFGKLEYSLREEKLMLPPYYGEVAEAAVKKLKDVTENLKQKEIMNVQFDLEKVDLRKIPGFCKDVEEENHYPCCVWLKDKARLLAYDESYEKVLNIKHQLLMKIGIIKPIPVRRRAANNTLFVNTAPVNLPPQMHYLNKETIKPELFYPSRGGKYVEKYTLNGITVYVYKADILRLSVDCIVNPANGNLSHGGGVSAVIARSAGDSLEREGNRYISENGRLPVGHACTTTAGRLHYKCVVHTVGPAWADYSPYTVDMIRKCEDDLYHAIYSSFIAAEKKKLKTIAVSAVSSAIFGVPAEICVNQYARVTMDYCKKAAGVPNALTEIHFIDMKLDIVKKIQEIFDLLVREGRKSPYDRTDYVKQATNSGRTLTVTKSFEEENCVICMDSISDPKTLKCGHTFCTECIEQQFKFKQRCPTCFTVCGEIIEDQPEGSMTVHRSSEHLAGYYRCGSIVITYNFVNGVQGENHPSPGRPYKGIYRRAYLPDNEEGRKVLAMLEVAFKRKLVFTIGSSRTTGQEGVIIWNDIHHKTDIRANTQFGYPDPTYLDRVKEELAAKGITEKDIKSK